MTEQRTYGESALLTPANMMTAFRLLVAPVFIYMISGAKVRAPAAATGLIERIS